MSNLRKLFIALRRAKSTLSLGMSLGVGVYLVQYHLDCAMAEVRRTGGAGICRSILCDLGAHPSFLFFRARNE